MIHASFGGIIKSSPLISVKGPASPQKLKMKAYIYKKMYMTLCYFHWHHCPVYYAFASQTLKKQSVFTLCFLTKPATCCFAALLRSLSAHFASRPARISDTARRSDTEIAHFTQLQLQCKMRQRSLRSRRRKAA